MTIVPLNNGVHKVVEDRGATLTCNANANPTAKNITWTNASGVVKSTTAVLSISKVLLADAGNYACTAANSLGKGQGTATLDVLYGPRITLASERVFKEGDAVAVECVVDSNPPPTEIHWFKDDVTVASGAWLNFTSIDRKNASDYYCSSSNVMVPTSPGEKETLSVNKPIKVCCPDLWNWGFAKHKSIRTIMSWVCTCARLKRIARIESRKRFE